MFCFNGIIYNMIVKFHGLESLEQNILHWWIQKPGGWTTLFSPVSSWNCWRWDRSHAKRVRGSIIYGWPCVYIYNIMIPCWFKMRWRIAFWVCFKNLCGSLVVSRHFRFTKWNLLWDVKMFLTNFFVTESKMSPACNRKGVSILRTWAQKITFGCVRTKYWS